MIEACSRCDGKAVVSYEELSVIREALERIQIVNVRRVEGKPRD